MTLVAYGLTTPRVKNPAMSESQTIISLKQAHRQAPREIVRNPVSKNHGKKYKLIKIFKKTVISIY